MRLSAFTYSLLSVLLLTLLPELAVTVTAPLTILIPPAAIPPSLLPPSTSASLTTLGVTYTAPLQRDSRFVFRNVSAGSYLLDVHCRDYAFAPLRVDVSDDGKGGLEVDAWQTWRGNEWGNKGERRGGGEVVEVSPVGGKEFYAERQGFSPLSLLKSPMILLAIVSMGLMFGLPYMLDNMDPEMRAEFEAQQKRTAPPSTASLQGFDLAGMLAGQQPGKGSSGGNGGSVRRKAGN
ncbi:MAG: hypothetical protein M1813_003489 [Trichoglossum hirsutum]|nr:MAG: hypothetical protein M1813_003489 [Trichoglossum hirsutum]